MKRTFKILMAAVLTLGATSVFAQKFGRLDYQATIFTMPEFATVQTELQKVSAEYQEQLESIQVELNRKVDEISKLPDTTTETTRQLKNREMLDLQQRHNDFYQMADEAIQKAQSDLMQPLVTKANVAIEKICKAQSIIMVFQVGSVVYIDEAQTIDITADVRKELGIPADAVPAAPAQ